MTGLRAAQISIFKGYRSGRENIRPPRLPSVSVRVG